MFFRVLKPLLPLIPLGLAAVAIVTLALGSLRIKRGRPKREAFTTALLDVLVGASLLAVLVLTLPPSIEARRSIELIPFRQSFHDSTRTAETVANILLFVPLGIFTPARWATLDRWRSVLVGALGFSVTIEAAQFLLKLGRQASITDVVLNTVGAALGYSLLLAWRWARRHGSKVARAA